jgi:mannan endo-1,4-beta-mannosidase
MHPRTLKKKKHQSPHRYVEQVHGPGHPKELFYTDDTVKAAYWAWVSTVLGRTNSITGTRYVDDPTIFAVELANEPHTTNRYELNQGLPPGKLVRDWVWDMAARIKGYPGFKGMVSTGEEGYRADGDVTSPHNVWINGGFKGVDFVGNTACPNISFATVHVYVFLFFFCWCFFLVFSCVVRVARRDARAA